ncbi:MAG: hypothetical protein IPN16_09470 [Gemmatimonadetes bacterium]|nr:hypothetical protein [Gemmatimonadota bacterium]
MKRVLVLTALSVLATACIDDVSPPTAPLVSASVDQETGATGSLGRYVAVGTSISMGWASDGVVGASQYQSWPAQLARMAGVPFNVPFLKTPGCRAPMAAPLASGVRISGEPVAIAPGAVGCSALARDAKLPLQNLAMSSATTYEALYVTPETRNDPFYTRLYSRIYPPNTTQLQAAFLAGPTFMSIEFGANEVLGSRDGRAIVGVTLFPVNLWQQVYAGMVGTVRANVPQGVVVGLIRDVSSFPAFRAGREMWADREAFLRKFNVQVLQNCRDNPNLISVPFLVPATVAAGVAAAKQGLPPVPMSCAAGPATAVDYVLDPTEVAIVNTQLAQMNAFIRAMAEQTGYAKFDLEVLYGMPALKPRFSVVTLMMTGTPYSAYMSLDGFHPSALGQNVLAAPRWRRSTAATVSPSRRRFSRRSRVTWSASADRSPGTSPARHFDGAPVLRGPFFPHMRTLAYLAVLLAVLQSAGGTRVTITEEGEIYNPVFRCLMKYVIGETRSIEAVLDAIGKGLSR